MLNYHNYEEYLVLHRPYFGIYLLTAVIFLTDLKGFRISKLIIVLFFLWFLWFIQVKMSFFILFVLIFIRMIFYAGLRARRILFITGFMLTFLVVSMGLQYYLKHRNNIDQLSQKERFWVLSLNTRLIHWDCGWRIFKDHVGVGIGSGNVSAQMNECYQTNHAGVFQFVKNFNIHNEFLEEAVRHGMVGAIIYFLCFFFFIKVAGSVRNMPYFSFLIIVILASITETILSREQGVLMIAFFNTIFYLSHMLRHQEKDSALQINDPSLSASFGSK
jgi:hypothetical protein